MTHSPDFGAESRRQSAPKIGAVSGTKNRRRKSTERIRNRSAPVGSDRHRSVWHTVQKIGTDFRRRLSAPKSGLCVMGFRENSRLVKSWQYKFCILLTSFSTHVWIYKEYLFQASYLLDLNCKHLWLFNVTPKSEALVVKCCSKINVLFFSWTGYSYILFSPVSQPYGSTAVV